MQQLLDTLLSVVGGLCLFFQLGASGNLGCFENVKSWAHKAARALGVRGDICHDTKRVSNDVFETFQTCLDQIQTETARGSSNPPGDAADNDKSLEMFGLAYAEALRVVCNPIADADTSSIPIACREDPPWQREGDLLHEDEVWWSCRRSVSWLSARAL